MVAAALEVLLEDTEVAEVELLVVDTKVDKVVPGTLVVDELEDPDEELTTAPPGPATEVVRDPLSI